MERIYIVTEEMKQILRLIASNPANLSWRDAISDLEADGYVYWSGSLGEWMLTEKGKKIVGDGEYQN